MQINTKFFPEIIPDNDNTYIKYLIAIIESVDELSSLEITRNPHSYHFRLAPSLPKYTELLLEEILKFHNMLQIRLILSKSIKTSAVINFEINLDN